MSKLFENIMLVLCIGLIADYLYSGASVDDTIVVVSTVMCIVIYILIARAIRNFKLKKGNE